MGMVCKLWPYPYASISSISSCTLVYRKLVWRLGALICWESVPKRVKDCTMVFEAQWPRGFVEPSESQLEMCLFSQDFSLQLYFDCNLWYFESLKCVPYCFKVVLSSKYKWLHSHQAELALLLPKEAEAASSPDTQLYNCPGSVYSL